MPAQLQLSLLNVPPALDAIAALPRPQHVILNHVYLQVRGMGGWACLGRWGRPAMCCGWRWGPSYVNGAVLCLVWAGLGRR